MGLAEVNTSFQNGFESFLPIFSSSEGPICNISERLECSLPSKVMFKDNSLGQNALVVRILLNQENLNAVQNVAMSV